MAKRSKRSRSKLDVRRTKKRTRSDRQETNKKFFYCFIDKPVVVRKNIDTRWFEMSCVGINMDFIQYRLKRIVDPSVFMPDYDMVVEKVGVNMPSKHQYFYLDQENTEDWTLLTYRPLNWVQHITDLIEKEKMRDELKKEDAHQENEKEEIANILMSIIDNKKNNRDTQTYDI